MEIQKKELLEAIENKISFEYISNTILENDRFDAPENLNDPDSHISFSYFNMDESKVEIVDNLNKLKAMVDELIADNIFIGIDTENKPQFI